MRVPNHDPGLAGADAAPLVGALALGERAVQQCHVDAQVVLQPVKQRHRQGNLRHQHERAAAGVQRRPDGRGVDAVLPLAVVPCRSSGRVRVRS